jgi:pantoate--beta-alanine ligase
MFDGISVLRSPCQLRAKVQAWRSVGDRVALVPVLGPVHEGHLRLVRAAQAEGMRVAACLVDVSGSCLPRDPERDWSVLEAAQADAVISPAGEAYCIDGYRTRLKVGGLTDVLCGKVEQGCFDFAVLMTLRLVNQTRADIVMLSDVQWQFCVILSQLVGDLDLGAELRILPAGRDDDGLPCSAEARALSADGRRKAARFSAVLVDSARAIRAGAEPVAACRAAAERLCDAGIEDVDYLELRHAGTLGRVHDPMIGGPARLFGSVRIDRLRLTDSIAVA